MILYRPVGLEELLLIFESAMRAFPPRLPDQPIFYPVLNEPYAAQIARDWNTKAGTFAGYVTRFSLPDDYAASFAAQTVGAREHRELWVPAERLAELNERILAPIEVIDAFFGAAFRGLTATSSTLAGKEAIAQLVALDAVRDPPALQREVAANRAAVFAHTPYWRHRSFEADGISDARRDALVVAIRGAWAEVSPEIDLPSL